MFLIVAILIQLSSSQTTTAKVTYNSKSYSFTLPELNVKNLMLAFNITSLECLQDLSGLSFYPYTNGGFPPFISSEVYVRQRPPAKIPTIIYTTEEKFVISNIPWIPAYTFLCVGYHMGAKHMRIIFLNFKDLSAINSKRKIDKVYLRLIGLNHEFNYPTQIFAHRVETDWQGIINWNQQPIYNELPSSFRIISNSFDVPFLWDVTEIVLEWIKGTLPNNGIVLKANDTFGIPTGKVFYSLDAVKKPCLMVYYSD